MTYCVAIKLNAGLVFLSDSRTNAGLDQISTFRKMIVYERRDDRFMVLLSAGNLSIAQSVREILQVEKLKDDEDGESISIWNARSMFDAARVLGAAVRRVHDRDADSLKNAGVEFNVSLIFGGQIKGEGMRLYQVYSAGNFIEATPETPYFQIGESKYGKPVLDRVITPETPLDEAAKCALVSMDSTLEVQSVGGAAARPGGLRDRPLRHRQGGLHRREQSVLPDAARQLGPEAARGLRQHRRPGVERRARPTYP
jgi:putative proteasome-type protease